MPSSNEGAGAPAQVTNARSKNDEELGTLLDRAVYYHPLIEHEHNDNYMYIGRKARREGCTLSDMNELIRIASQRYSDDKYNYKRIYECIMWGYDNVGNYCQDNF